MTLESKAIDRFKADNDCVAKEDALNERDYRQLEAVADCCKRGEVECDLGNSQYHYIAE